MRYLTYLAYLTPFNRYNYLGRCEGKNTYFAKSAKFVKDAKYAKCV
jgi:hypothetical protein